jgi:hypothetical protein
MEQPDLGRMHRLRAWNPDVPLVSDETCKKQT